MRVHAFNPHRSFMAEMRQNLMQNGQDGSVCLHEYAVSDRSNETVRLEYAVGSGINWRAGGHEHGRDTWAECQTTTLDDWAKAAEERRPLLDQPAFLLAKFDIEGAAAAALHGMPKLLPKVTHWFIGIHNEAEWAAATAAFNASDYDILVQTKRGKNDPNGAFIAFKRDRASAQRGRVR